MQESGTCCTSIINLRYQEGSEGSPSNPAKFNGQDYVQLKDYHVRKRWLFVDNAFPPNSRSLGNLPGLDNWDEDHVEWLRPADILKRQQNSSEPVFLEDGVSRFDFGQGMIGNCWFLAAFSSLTFKKNLLVQVVPMEQSFKDYAGIFHFRFWTYGKWVDVVIDDYLPTMDNRLLFVFSKTGNEFWAPLLEKAYAKVCGSYADMNYGTPSDACKDFSGGVSKFYPLREAHSLGRDVELWQSLGRAIGCQSMICCATPPKNGNYENTVSPSGLVDAHAYSVTGVTEVEYNGSEVKLVRLMNPWGEQEWNGKWSDKSPMWNDVSPEDREKCINHNNGEFWMELEDVCRHFTVLSISCENPNFIDGDHTCQWKSMSYEGSWVAGKSAGGSPSEYMTFETNPQYRIQVTVIDKKEPGDMNIMLSLMQKPYLRNRNHGRLFPIGLTIYKIPPGTPNAPVETPFFYENEPVKDRDIYTMDRELIEEHSLEPGEYVIIPYTLKPFMTADFILTVYTKSECKISHHEKHNHVDGISADSQVPGKDVNGHDDNDPDYALFSRYADQDGKLNAYQLQKLLNENFPHGTNNGFGLDACRSMGALVDTEQKMTTSFTEFLALWGKIHEYKSLFHRSDLTRNGTLSDFELQKAIKSSGIDVTDFRVRQIMFRYSGQSATTTLKRFIVLMIRLEKSLHFFEHKSHDGLMELTWDEWCNYFMYS